MDKKELKYVSTALILVLSILNINNLVLEDHERIELLEKSFKKIDGISRIIELGKDTYSDGSLSIESIKLVCETLSDFKRKMK